MKDYFMSDVLVEQGGFLQGKEMKSRKIRINNPDNDRPINIFIGTAVILSIISIFMLNIDWIMLFSRVGELAGVFIELSQFNFTNFDLVAVAFMESVTVTLLATLYSLVGGLLMGAFMARNITPSKKLAGVLSSYNSFIRAVPTPIWVLLIIACLGFGPAPGIIGLSFHATAFFARAFSQAFEEVPQATIEALQATGANRIQIFFSAVLPASMTALIAWSAMRFEINFSESTILGMVGGGGIGYSIAASVTGYNFGRAGISILMVFVFAYCLEIMFTAIKRRMKA
ncbi:MAG: ABC transporter permease subunit [Clostridia bacterium]|nr:ABC transporter permease subunit [Clostridia bacterium]